MTRGSEAFFTRSTWDSDVDTSPDVQNPRASVDEVGQHEFERQTANAAAALSTGKELHELNGEPGDTGDNCRTIFPGQRSGMVGLPM